MCPMIEFDCLDPNVSMEHGIAKELTASAFGLEITSVKPKKTVTISDPAAVSIRRQSIMSIVYVIVGFLLEPTART
jgi:hypothetical protein